MTRVVTLPSGATLVPRFCSANSPERCSVLGSIRSTLLGGLISLVSAVNTIMLSVAAIKIPTPNAQRSSVPRIRRSWTSLCASSVIHSSAHCSARQKNKNINREISEDQECDCGSGEHAGSERNSSHCFCKRRRIYFIRDFGWIIRGGRLISRHPGPRLRRRK